MMELQIKRLLLVFTMFYVRATINVESTTSPSNIQKVERTLLTALGMKSKPVIDRKKVHIPEALLNLYKMKSEYESTDLPLPGKLTRSANIVRSYTHQESEVDARFPHNHKFRMLFDLSDLPENEALISSELRLTIIVPKDRTSSSRSNNESISDSNSFNLGSDVAQCRDPYVHVYDIVQPGIRGLSQPILRRVETARVRATQSAINLDVLPIVERWLSNDSHSHNHGLLVEVRSLNGAKCASHVRLRRSPPEAFASPPAADDTRWQAEQPLLLLYTEDEQRRRSRRAAQPLAPQRRKRSARPRKRQRYECRRYPLQVRFKDVGWDDWIVAPSDYHAYYCAGECPTTLSDHMNTTNHAVVQALISSVYPEKITRPCCVPTSLSSISLLYLNENGKAVLKNYDNMVVEGCGCR